MSRFVGARNSGGLVKGMSMNKPEQMSREAGS